MEVMSVACSITAGVLNSFVRSCNQRRYFSCWPVSDSGEIPQHVGRHVGSQGRDTDPGLRGRVLRYVHLGADRLRPHRRPPQRCSRIGTDGHRSDCHCCRLRYRKSRLWSPNWIVGPSVTPVLILFHAIRAPASGHNQRT